MVGRQVQQYQFTEKLGAGGMGEIYKALDTRLSRTVAIKVLPSAKSGDPDRRRRFLQEAQAASGLNHPSIITIPMNATETAIEGVISFLVSAGFDVHRSSGHTRSILGVVGEVGTNDVSVVSELEGVAHVTLVSEPFRLASRRFRQRSTVVEGPWGSIGGVNRARSWR